MVYRAGDYHFDFDGNGEFRAGTRSIRLPVHFHDGGGRVQHFSRHYIHYPAVPENHATQRIPPRGRHRMGQILPQHQDRTGETSARKDERDVVDQAKQRGIRPVDGDESVDPGKNREPVQGIYPQIGDGWTSQDRETGDLRRTHVVGTLAQPVDKQRR